MTEPNAVANDTWAKLHRPEVGLSARHHPVSDDVWLAIDSGGRRHLIVRAVDGEPDVTLLSTRGLDAVITRLSFEDEPEATWADIICLAPELNGTFAAVASDLVENVQAAPGQLLDAVRKTLRTWQWFWGIDSTALSIEAELGLLGEVWFIDRWAPFPEVLDVWRGPSGYRHDFSSTDVSVEVKTTRVRSDGAARHRIANLDQLSSPETGQLHLFSLQVVADPNATNTLASLIDRVRRRLHDQPDLSASFDSRLAQARWSPARSQEPSRRWRIVTEEMYEVVEGFPRLTRKDFPAGVPSGVDDVSYSLDLAACATWRVATQPQQAASLLSALHL